MNHPTLLELNMYADKALDAGQHSRVNEHVKTCAGCARHVQVLRQEAAVLRRALQVAPVNVPAFHTPVRLSDLLRGTLILAGFAWLLVWIWQTVVSADLRTVLAWFRPSTLSESISLSIDTVFFVSEEGSNMLGTLYSIALTALAFVSLCWWLCNKPQVRTAFTVGCCLLLAGVGVARPAEAIEIRREDKGDSLTIAATEVIDDSLLMAGQTIIVEGRVEGDLIAAGQRVIIAGEVSGNLIVFAQNVTVRGTIEGSVLGFAQSLEMEGEVQGSMMSFSESTSFSGASILRDMWTYSGRFDLDSNSAIEGNATMFTGNATLDGSIGRDLTGFAERIEVSGHVGEDIQAWIRTLALFDSARVEGDVNYRAREESGLQRSAGAVINGSVTYDDSIYEITRPNRFATVRYYMNQLFRLGAAFLAGICLFTLFPGLKQVSLSRGMEGLKAAGAGLLALVSAPVIAVILAITIIGLPLSVVVLFGWALVWYFAKIMLAWIIGSMVLANSRHDAMPLKLLAGLAIILVVINLPMIGGILSACMTWVGAGLLVLATWENTQRKNTVLV